MTSMWNKTNFPINICIYKGHNFPHAVPFKKLYSEYLQKVMKEVSDNFSSGGGRNIGYASVNKRVMHIYAFFNKVILGLH